MPAAPRASRGAAGRIPVREHFIKFARHGEGTALFRGGLDAHHLRGVRKREGEHVAGMQLAGAVGDALAAEAHMSLRDESLSQRARPCEPRDHEPFIEALIGELCHSARAALRWNGRHHFISLF
jgi:hypothetical protein